MWQCQSNSPCFKKEKNPTKSLIVSLNFLSGVCLDAKNPTYVLHWHRTSCLSSKKLVLSSNLYKLSSPCTVSHYFLAFALQHTRSFRHVSVKHTEIYIGRKKKQKNTKVHTVSHLLALCIISSIKRQNYLLNNLFLLELLESTGSYGPKKRLTGNQYLLVPHRPTSFLWA